MHWGTLFDMTVVTDKLYTINSFELTYSIFSSLRAGKNLPIVGIEHQTKAFCDTHTHTHTLYVPLSHW